MISILIITKGTHSVNFAHRVILNGLRVMERAPFQY